MMRIKIIDKREGKRRVIRTEIPDDTSKYFVRILLVNQFAGLKTEVSFAKKLVLQ